MDPTMCRAGCGFFGSEKFDSFCSKCFNLHCKEDHGHREQPAPSQKPSASPALPPPTPRVEEKPAAVGAAAAEEAKPKKRNRCRECSKRVGLTGFSCRCGGLFCAEHRYDREHNCDFDFKTLERGWIREKNPVVQAEKIQKI